MTRAWETFTHSAIDYYVAGRFGALARLNPTAANLLHHAVEMALKAALSKKGLSLDKLKKLNHNLPKIWRLFKTKCGVSPDKKFDQIVSELHKYDDIRYPQFKPPPTMSSAIGIGMKPSTTSKPSPKEVRYELWLGEIDELMSRIFSIASINHTAFTSGLFQHARECLTDQNAEAAWQL